MFQLCFNLMSSMSSSRTKCSKDLLLDPLEKGLPRVFAALPNARTFYFKGFQMQDLENLETRVCLVLKLSAQYMAV